MATIKLNPLISDIRKKMDTVVFSKWKDTNYIRRHVVPKDAQSAEQVEVRKAFKGIVSLWQLCSPLIHTGWNMTAKNKNYTGYNAFIAANSNSFRTGSKLELFKENGLAAFKSFSAEADSTPGQISCIFEADLNSECLTIFAHKLTNASELPELKRYDFAAGSSSPLTIEGLQAETDYHIYLVLSDAPYTSASLNSKSLCVSVKTT